MSTARTILVVEDDRFLRRACEVSLQQRGFVVKSACDGEAGLQLARESMPDLILLDLLMPKMSGIELLEALRKDPAIASTPVLILSNSSREEDKAHATRLGAIGYFVKANLSLRALGDEVERLLEQSSGAGRQQVVAMTTRTARAESDAQLVCDRLVELADDTGMAVAELQTMWATDTSDRLERAVTALAAGDLAETVHLVHAAAGTTGLCGAAQLSADLSVIEHHATEGRAAAAGQALDLARADFNQLTSVLQGRLEK
jgi:DNA-binding response OmpR family regulator